MTAKSSSSAPGPPGSRLPWPSRTWGSRPLVVDKADAVGSSWRGRYDRLRLNTCRALLAPSRPAVRQGHADVPDARPGGRPPRPARAARAACDVELGTQVEGIRRDDERMGGGHVRRRRRGAAGGRRHRLRERSGDPRLARTRCLRRPAGALARVPERRALPRQQGARRRPGLLGHGDRLRPRRGRRREGLAVGANPSEHPDPPGPGGSPAT